MPQKSILHPIYYKQYEPMVNDRQNLILKNWAIKIWPS